MTTLLNSAAQVLSPFSSNNAVVTVSEVTMNSSGQGTIVWSTSLNGTPYTNGTSVTLPANIQAIPNATNQTTLSLIWGHVAYTYTPSIGYKVTGPIVLYDDIYLQPRLSATISYPAATTSP